MKYNIDEIKEEFLHLYFDEDDLIEYVENKVQELNNLGKNITLYRVVFLEDKKFLDTENLGVHWTNDGNILDNDFLDYLKFECNEEEILGKPYILKASFNSEHVNKELCLHQYLYNPNEDEITLLKSSKAENYQLYDYDIFRFIADKKNSNKINPVDFPELFEKIEKSNNLSSEIPFLYHVTPKENLESILKNGLQIKFFGEIHEEMEVRPASDNIYLSKFKESNNLNNNIYTRGDLVSLKIDISSLDTSLMYPDDAFFNAFANEDYLVDAEEISKEFNINIDEATRLLDILDNLNDKDFAETVKPLATLYLKSQGEISYSTDIKSDAIKEVLTLKNKKSNYKIS
jgi:hypothetical protein